MGDCGGDVTVNRALLLVLAVLEKHCNAVPVLGLTDQREKTGVPTLQEAEGIIRLVARGRFLAACALVERGAFDYDHDEVTYAIPITKDAEDLDADILEQVREAARAEMDCQVCYALFCDPVTTPCGHTFCRRCLQRVLDYARLCPICRRVLTVEPMLYPQACLTNYLITSIITTFWADLLEARKENVIAESLHDGNTQYDIPVFVCTLAFPFTPTFLHVFEPRYRLMVRRALEGDRTFGMVMYHNGSFVELGTILRIVNVEFYPDGRNILETVGVSRFRILRHGLLDGYTVANIQKIYDVTVSEEEELEVTETRVSGERSIPPPMLPNSEFPTTSDEIETLPTRVLMEFAGDFVRRMTDQSVDWLATRILAIYGECPRDPAIFPWWLASVLPVRNMEKYRLLGTTSVRERLKICCGWALEWERTQWSFSNCLMS